MKPGQIFPGSDSLVFPDVAISHLDTPPGHGFVLAFQPEVMPVFESQRSEPATVGTARIQGNNTCDPFVGRREHYELSPVSKDNPQWFAGTVRNLEPGQRAFFLRRGPASFPQKIDTAAEVAPAQLGKAVGDETQAFPACQVFPPAQRTVPLKMQEQILVAEVLQYSLQLACALPRFLQVPLGRKPGMNHGETEHLAVVQDRLVTKPEQEFLAVGGIEDLGDRVLLAKLDSSGSHGEEVQIMVAEYANSGGTEAAHKAQQLQRVGSLVNEIPGKPETVDIRVEVKLLQ